jgi:hypothetical protein
MFGNGFNVPLIEFADFSYSSIGICYLGLGF